MAANITINSRTSAHIQPTAMWGNLGGTMTDQKDLQGALQGLSYDTYIQTSRCAKVCRLEIVGRELHLFAPRDVVKMQDIEKELVFARYVRTSVRLDADRYTRAGWVTPLIPIEAGFGRKGKYFVILAEPWADKNDIMEYRLRFHSEPYRLDTPDIAMFLGTLQEKSVVETKTYNDGTKVTKHLQLLNKKLGIGITSTQTDLTPVVDFLPFTVRYNKTYGISGGAAYPFSLSRWTDNVYQLENSARSVSETQVAKIHKVVAAMDLTPYTLKASDQTETSESAGE